MKLLVIGPHQRKENEESFARQALQASQVEKYTVLTPQEGENKYTAGFRILRQGRSEEYDTISAQDPFFSGLIAWYLARHKGARLNIQVHTDLSAQSLLRHVLAQIILCHADSIRVVSEKIKEQVLYIGAHAPVYVLPVFVDVSKYASIVHKSHSGKNILWIGRFENEKDPLCAVKILKEVRQKGVDAKLIMLGKGNLESELQRATKGLPVEMPDWQDPVPYLEIADVVLSTSRHESWGASIVEALAAGVPVVAPDVGIAREAGAVVVSHKKLGEAVVETLCAGTRGNLQISILSADEWGKKWKESLV